MNEKPAKNDDAAEQYEFDNLKIELPDDAEKIGIFRKIWNHVKYDHGKVAGNL